MTNLDKYKNSSKTSRRDFIRQTTLLASSALVGFNSFAAKSKFEMGLQLFTIRDPLSKDAKGTLNQVASLGYENLETYGFDPVRINYYGYSAKDFRKLLEDLGLKTTTGHYDFTSFLSKPDDDLKRYVDKWINALKGLTR